MKPKQRDDDRPDRPPAPRRTAAKVAATVLLLTFAAGGVAYAQYVVTGQGTAVVTVAETLPAECPVDTATTSYVCPGDPDWTASGGEVTFEDGHVVVPAGTAYTGSVPQIEGLTVSSLQDLTITLTPTGSPQSATVQFEIRQGNGNGKTETVTVTFPPGIGGTVSASQSQVTVTDKKDPWTGTWAEFVQQYGSYNLPGTITVTATDTDLHVDAIKLTGTTVDGPTTHTIDFTTVTPA